MAEIHLGLVDVSVCVCVHVYVQVCLDVHLCMWGPDRSVLDVISHFYPSF